MEPSHTATMAPLIDTGLVENCPENHYYKFICSSQISPLLFSPPFSISIVSTFFYTAGMQVPWPSTLTDGAEVQNTDL